MRIFILEDNHFRINHFKRKFAGHDLVIIEYALAAILYLGGDLNFDLISLDHDLGNKEYVNSEEENTGYQVAKFLSQKKVKCPIVIHSMNPVGAEAMKKCLPNAIILPMLVDLNLGEIKNT